MKGLAPLLVYQAKVKRRPNWVKHAEGKNAMLVHDMKVLKPDYFAFLTLQYLSLSYRHTKHPNTWFLAYTLEGWLQNITTRILFRGVPTDHGAVIPIKRFVANSYKSYTSTWAMLLWNKEELLVPYMGQGFVKAKINEYNNARTILLVDNPDDVIPFLDREIMEPAYIYRGSHYEMYYEYLRLGVTPPRYIKFDEKRYIFEEGRGPLKLLKTTVYVLRRPLVFLFASVSSVVRDLVHIAERADFPVTSTNKTIAELFKCLPLVGFKHEGVLEAAYEDLCFACENGGPEKLLFAEVDGKNQFIALRPMPASLWSPSEILNPYLVFNIRPTPPYYYGLNGPRKTPRTPHITPGNVVSKLPRLAYEVG